MARNEEKQLARLNRFYLEKQKQEELKKRPPRPRLDTLNTPRELRKWLPTITRDIEFYVKQMEVTCYTAQKIEEIEVRIQRLKQEYRAYLHRLRALEPELSAASWAHRPYSQRKRHTGPETEEAADGSEESKAKTMSLSPASDGAPPPPFVPIATPVLQRMSTRAVNQHNFEHPAPLVWNVDPDTEDQPLQFKVTAPPRTLALCHRPPATATARSSGIGSSLDRPGNRALELASSSSGIGSSLDRPGNRALELASSSSGIGSSLDRPGNRALELASSSSGTDNASDGPDSEHRSLQCTPSTPCLSVSQQAYAGGRGCRAGTSLGKGRSSEEGISSATGAPSNIRSGREGRHALQLSPSRLSGKAGCVSEDSHDRGRSGTSVKTSRSSEDTPQSAPLTISGGTSVGGMKCQNTPSTGRHEPSTSAEYDMMDRKADLTRTTHTTHSETTKGEHSSRLESDRVEKPAGISASSAQNKTVNVLPAAREISDDGCGVHSTSGQAKMPDPAAVREQWQGLSSQDFCSRVQNERLASSNPLNLGYSDSSDEDV